MDRYLYTKFGVNLLDEKGENGFYGCTTDGGMDDGQTTDARVTAALLLCVQYHKTELKRITRY